MALDADAAAQVAKVNKETDKFLESRPLSKISLKYYIFLGLKA